MDRCVTLTVVLALSTQIATAGRYFRNDGRDFHHSFDHVDPYKWHDGKRWDWEDAKEIHPQKFHKPRQQEGGNNKFWHQHPDRWESDSDSDSGSWDYPYFSHNAEWHRNQPREWNHGNWNHGPTHHQGHNPNGNHWNQGGNNQQGGHKPNWNQGGWNQNPGANPPSQMNPSWQNQQGGSNDNDPSPTWNQASGNTWGQPTTAAPAATQAPLATALCIRSCPVTSEFNPVCGSNNVTYGNIGRLECAKYCGVDVTMRSKQPCTAANTPNFPPQPPINTNVPFPDPTRFTTVEVPPITNPTPVDPNVDTGTASKFTIPQDVLNSIFTSTTPSPSLPDGVTDDDNYDIDIRTKNRNNFLNSEPQVYDLPPTS